jgi:hypothetical protein
MTLGELALAAHLSALAPEVLVKTVVEAPELHMHERAAVATVLAKQGLDRILPVPQVLQERVRRDILAVPTVLLDSERTWARGECAGTTTRRWASSTMANWCSTSTRRYCAV